jgi:hypothetical protein
MRLYWTLGSQLNVPVRIQSDHASHNESDEPPVNLVIPQKIMYPLSCRFQRLSGQSRKQLSRVKRQLSRVEGGYGQTLIKV